MKLKRLKIIICITMIVAITSVTGWVIYSKHNSKSAASLNAEGYGEELNKKLKEGWIVPSVDVDYKSIKNINEKKVQELKLSIPEEMERVVIKEDNSGNILAAGTIMKGDDKKDSYPESYVKIMKFDVNGKILWDRNYDVSVYWGWVSNLKITSSGDFIFTVDNSTYSDPNKNWNTNFDYIVKCEKNGNVLWQNKYEYETESLFENLLITEDEEIITIGISKFEGEQPLGKHKDGISDDVILMKFDKNGKQQLQKRFGGSNFESCVYADYSMGTGVIFSCLTYSRDGDIKCGSEQGKTMQYGRSLLVGFDKNLNEKWQYFAEEDENFSFCPVIIDKDSIITLGDIGKNRSSSIWKFNNKGEKLWTLEMDNTKYSSLSSAKILDSGKIIAFGGRRDSMDSNWEEIIAIVNQSGKLEKVISNIKARDEDIQPTNDGGFLATYLQDVKALPQPKYQNRISMDLEKIAVKYDKNYKIEWRKTYDKYKNQEKIDLVFPLSDGRVIIRP